MEHKIKVGDKVVISNFHSYGEPYKILKVVRVTKTQVEHEVEEMIEYIKNKKAKT
jgi:hypothetical protein